MRYQHWSFSRHFQVNALGLGSTDAISPFISVNTGHLFTVQLPTNLVALRHAQETRKDWVQPNRASVLESNEVPDGKN